MAIEARDRLRDPCPDCGEELYDKYYGQGGWAPTEIATGRTHHATACVKRLKAKAIELEGLITNLKTSADDSGIECVKEVMLVCVPTEGGQADKLRALLGRPVRVTVHDALTRKVIGR